jgi:PAS domain S-box-containing protein
MVFEEIAQSFVFWSATMQVLMIEDNENDYFLVNHSITKDADVKIQWRRTFNEGLAYLRANGVDVLLLDLGLPDANGLDALGQLQTKFPALPIIILSATDEDEVALEAVRRGAQDYLVKGKTDAYTLRRALRYAIERKQVQTALATERNMLRTLVDSIPDYVYLKDKDSRFVLVNKAVLKAGGFTHMEQLAGKTDFDFLPPDIAQIFYDDEQKVFKTGRELINREEQSVDVKTGEEVWFSTNKVPLLDESGMMTGLLGISWNITERKRMENVLKALHEITVELTTIDDLDQFYKRAVELGLQRLGFDRLGLLLYDAEAGVALGTYGTDTHGQVVAEHHLRFDPAALTSILMRALQKEERFAVDEVTLLFNNFEPIGPGWNAAAILWNGVDKLGWLCADNGTKHESLKQSLVDVLALYAVTLGTLLAQKRSQIAVRENEKRLRLLAANSPDFIYILPLNEPSKAYINRTEFLGYSQSDMQGIRSLFDAVHPSDRERVLTHWQTVITQVESKRQELIEYRLQDKAGQWRWIKSRETVYAEDADGKPTQILVTITDITERKKAEENLIQERDLLRTLIDNLPDIIFIKDREGRFILSNIAHAQSVNLKADEIVDKTTSEIFPPDLAARSQAEEEQIIQSGQPLINSELIRVGKNGERQTLLSSKIPLRDKNGQITSLIGILRDITERKQLESQTLELASERGRIKVLQRFINDMSHDFRTPLTSINNSLYLLKRSSDPLKQEVYIKRAQEHIQRMDKLLEELLQMEYLDKGETAFQFSWTDFNEFIPPLIHDYEPLSTANQIRVEFVAHAQPCMAFIDLVEFARVMTKLLDNAIAFTPYDGQVTVQTRTENGWAIISIEDTGVGISPEDLPHIFERFYRADQARSTDTGGSGIGLSIVQKVIEAHNGLIEVESVLGEGSKFTIRLPANKE